MIIWQKLWLKSKRENNRVSNNGYRVIWNVEMQRRWTQMLNRKKDVRNEISFNFFRELKNQE